MAKRGFTLIELMIVITIISLVAAFGLAANYRTAQKTARDGRRKSDLEQVRSALEMYRTDTESYPGGGYSGLGGVLVPDYLNPLPLDPKNSDPYIYTYSGGGNSYSLCANQLERTGIPYCVTNP